MTAEQFERWKQFSRGMALRGWEQMTDARRQKLLAKVDMWFNCIGDEWQHMISWDESEVVGTNQYGHPQQAMYACDWITEMFDNYFGCGDRYAYRDNEGDLCYEHARFYGQISCCLRAGMDVAAEPSAGVIGFDVAAVTRIFEGTIPEWFVVEYPGVENAEPSVGVWL